MLFILLSTACSASESQPDYLAQIGDRSRWLCGGYAIDPWHVVTAAHCTRYSLTQVQVGDGDPVAVVIVAKWPELDAALYETAQPLMLSAYATLRAMEPTRPGYAFGYCPLWQSSSARLVRYTATETYPLACNELRIEGAWICNGDSGGIITQGGQVVGMIAQFRGAAFALDDGMNIAYSTCAVRGEAIQERIAEWRGER